MSKTKRINLALQGGGAHGAFTWGVLDKLLEDEEIEIAAISGASAGALNGAALKSGLVQGDRQTAKDNLDWLWTQVGAVRDLRTTSWMKTMMPGLPMMTQFLDGSQPLADVAGAFFSPYSYGPFYRNPLEKIAQRFRYEHICKSEGPELHISATNVRTGKIRVFKNEEITADVILASACLPSVFQAIDLTDPKTGVTDPFWDGGYTGNPALFPLYEKHLPDDVVIVNINPLVREGTPMSPQEIDNRINEISFNSSLLRELRAINFVRELIAEGRMDEGRMKNVLVHMIADDEIMRQLSVSTKMIASPWILSQLKAAGRASATAFLRDKKKFLNKEGTVNLEEMFG